MRATRQLLCLPNTRACGTLARRLCRARFAAPFESAAARRDTSEAHAELTGIGRRMMPDRCARSSHPSPPRGRTPAEPAEARLRPPPSESHRAPPDVFEGDGGGGGGGGAALDDPSPSSSAAALDDPSSFESGWKARRRRRRDRQRAAREAYNAAHHVAGSTHHWAVTSERHLREAIRAQLRTSMRRGWDDGGSGGLRVVVDCGMQHLMTDAELRSLVTQLQCSYASVLSITTDEVLRVSRDRAATREDATPPREGSPASTEREEGRETTEDDEKCAEVPPRLSAKERKAAAALAAIAGAGRAGAPLRLMFSSLTGRLKTTLARDGGSVRWPVTTSEEPFASAALRAAAGDGSRAVAAEGERTRRRPRVIVMSPDAPQAITEAPSTDDIFVVGGLCDYKRVANATLDRAEAAGVEARRLPIEEILGPVSVNILTVNQTVEALCRAHLSSGDWRAALEAVLPPRKLEEMLTTRAHKERQRRS